MVQDSQEQGDAKSPARQHCYGREASRPGSPREINSERATAARTESEHPGPIAADAGFALNRSVTFYERDWNSPKIAASLGCNDFSKYKRMSRFAKQNVSPASRNLTSFSDYAEKELYADLE
jgi:hypothetical protein